MPTDISLSNCAHCNQPLTKKIKEARFDDTLISVKSCILCKTIYKLHQNCANDVRNISSKSEINENVDPTDFTNNTKIVFRCCYCRSKCFICKSTSHYSNRSNVGHRIVDCIKCKKKWCFMHPYKPMTITTNNCDSINDEELPLKSICIECKSSIVKQPDIEENIKKIKFNSTSLYISYVFTMDAMTHFSLPLAQALRWKISAQALKWNISAQADFLNSI
mgnify:CR=1 FL=1